MPATSGSGPIALAYARLASCSREQERIEATANLLLVVFDDFYRRLCEYPYEAQRAFESRDPQASVRISQERLHLYSRYIAHHGPRIHASFPELAIHGNLWDAIEALFLPLIAERYEADIAFSFAHSLRRNIGHDTWRPVAYSFPPPDERRALSLASVYRRFPVNGSIDTQLLTALLRAPGFNIAYRNAQADLRALQRFVTRRFGAAEWDGPAPRALDVVQAGFYRDHAAFVVARWQMSDGSVEPLVVAFLNEPDGIRVDAVLDRTADIHNLFSSALANFHVTTRLYYQTCVFLFRIMPRRPLGLQYSTIGFNHVGKVAIVSEIVEQMRTSGQRFGRSPGAPGTVALGFTYESCSYHLKVIRDRPTKAYKWGEYPGTAAVLEKYRVVHEINRAGSMLDNVMYFHLRLDRDLFDPDLLAEILDQAAGSVQVEGDAVFLRTLIIQLKIVPLPAYLASADSIQTRTVMASLGRCIRNNAATNIFNKDLDCRNYGVGRYGRVFLFDYDAVERLTDVKIRTNLDREPGEDIPPDWFFEEGTVFLPEELESGMQFQSREAMRCFRLENPDLLGVDYWRAMQERLQRGEVPELSMYPEICRLPPAGGPAARSPEDAAGAKLADLASGTALE